MQEITHKNFLQFIKTHDKLIFHDRKREIIFKLGLPKEIQRYQPSADDFEMFTTYKIAVQFCSRIKYFRAKRLGNILKVTGNSLRSLPEKQED